MTPNEAPQNQSDMPLKWYVLTTLDPKDSEEHLSSATMPYFIPYQFLKRHSTSLPHVSDATVPGSSTMVRANNEIRSILRRYVFVRSTEEQLSSFLHGDWNQYSNNRLQFFLDKARNKVTVHDSMMDRFMEACSDLRLRFEICTPLDDIETDEEVVLNTTPFRGERAKVLEVHHTPHGVDLTLGLQIFTGSIILRLTGVSERDIIRYESGNRKTDSRHLIDNMQRRLLQVLSRHVHGKHTPESLQRDHATLDLLSSLRPPLAKKASSARHFLALQLICAYLRKDDITCRELSEKAETALSIIEAEGQQKAGSDVQAYLNVALYIATGNPAYREAAKSYVKERQPSSQALRRFVSLIRVKRVRPLKQQALEEQ